VTTTCDGGGNGAAPTTEERFSSSLHASSRSWRMALDRRLKHLGLSQASWMAIASIAKYDTQPSQTELAAKLGVEDPTMVAMIDRLVKAGYVLRQPSETDRRVKLVVLTDAGKLIYAEVMEVATSFRMQLLKDVDPATLLLVTEFLETVQAMTESAL
jgi:MarR family transcriptional regulator for hemolysin